MKNQRLEIIKTYYESKMGKNLPDYGILGWESEEAQRARFEILLSSVDLSGKRLLDVGCGLGNLLDFIKQKKIKVDYTGVDILQSMVNHAQEKNKDAKVYCVDIFKSNPFKAGSFDIIYASGIFNLNLNNNAEFLIRALNLFLDLSCEAVVFNLLHHASPDKEKEYSYFSPDEVKRILEGMSDKIKRVNLIEDYLQNDFTVVCYKI